MNAAKPQTGTQRSRVLSLLYAHGKLGATTADFLEARIPRFSARIEELRKQGYEIQTSRERKGSYRYTLVSEPQLDGAPGSHSSARPAGVNRDPSDKGSEAGSLFTPEAPASSSAAFDPWALDLP